MHGDRVLHSCAGADYIPPDVTELSAGDAVRVELDPDLFKIAQEDHGGWNNLMAEVRYTHNQQCTNDSWSLANFRAIHSNGLTKQLCVDSGQSKSS